MDNTSDRRVGISIAERITCRDRSTIWRLYTTGKFPAPVFIGERRTWLESELLAWVAEQAARPRPARRGNKNIRAASAPQSAEGSAT